MDKRKLLGTIIGILLFALCVTGISYAYYSWKSNETEVSLTIEDVKFEFLTDSSVNATNIGTILDYKDSNYYTEENKNKYLVYTDFIVDNQINKKYYINISLNINSIDISLINQSFKYVLLKGDDDSYDYNSPVSEGNFSNFTLGKNSIITNFFQSVSLKSSNIIHKPNSNTVHKLFPDSKYPLYPIPSKYVYDEVWVIIEKNMDIIYIVMLINTDFPIFSLHFGNV